ncbi:MAG: type II toxin-antitoxin system VapC family toxin [Nitrospirae bacterium]|nr:type II toxin-antitoxin system VapC family toxin [Nitrospirota bacterium]
MKGIDTNVLVRYLVKDDSAQSNKASRFIARECSRESPCLINRIVLCDLVWVLESAYGYPKETIAAVLEQILRTSQFQIEDLPAAWIALREYRKGRAGFADCFLGVVNRRLGCEHTATFDASAGRMEGFLLLS